MWFEEISSRFCDCKLPKSGSFIRRFISAEVKKQPSKDIITHVCDRNKITTDSNKLFGWDGVPNLNERQWRSGSAGCISTVFLEKYSSNRLPKKPQKYIYLPYLG